MTHVQGRPPVLPDDLLSGWEVICERASPGPWIANIDGAKFYCGFLSTSHWTVWEPGKMASTRNMNNVRFVESARSALPLLITEIRRLKAELAKEKT